MVETMSIELYTAQISQWRGLKENNIELIDTTVKSGYKEFAPTWDIVTSVKNNVISEQAYVDVYIELMRESYVKHRNVWLHVLTKPKIAIGCYCKPGIFCHRHVLKDYFLKVAEKHNINLTYMGEFHVSKY